VGVTSDFLCPLQLFDSPFLPPQARPLFAAVSFFLCRHPTTGALLPLLSITSRKSAHLSVSPFEFLLEFDTPLSVRRGNILWAFPLPPQTTRRKASRSCPCSFAPPWSTRHSSLTRKLMSTTPFLLFQHFPEMEVVLAWFVSLSEMVKGLLFLSAIPSADKDNPRTHACCPSSSSLFLRYTARRNGRAVSPALSHAKPGFSYSIPLSHIALPSPFSFLRGH